MQERYQKGHFKELFLHTDLVLVFDIKSSTFDEVFHHWQVSMTGCPVECCLLCISEIKPTIVQQEAGNFNVTLCCS